MLASASPYDVDLGRNPANHVALSPLSFLMRASLVHPRRTAVIYGDWRCDWAQLADRCARFAGALAQAGIGRGDTVAMMAPNTPPAIEAHFAVPMTGGVLNMLNIRLDAAAIAFQLEHGGAKILLVDAEFNQVVRAAVAMMTSPPQVIGIADPAIAGAPLGDIDYEAFLATATPLRTTLPEDEWDAIALNYTSGTTGDPKGVVYHHRGACLNAVSNALAWPMTPHPVLLWTLPAFHCNGWCFPWTVALLAGTNVCLRTVDPTVVFEQIDRHEVEYLCGAPIVMTILANAPPSAKRPLRRKVQMMTAGAPPPAAVISDLEADGFEVLQVYGLTEVYGPSTVCVWQEAWDQEPHDQRMRRKASQGVIYPLQQDLMVADPDTLAPLPKDGASLGEVFLRGNSVMKGYLKNPAATGAAFRGGWFHTGDLGVWREDGYIELRDRSKDIIISGGENISTIEVEGVLYQHPAVLEAAVVQRPDAHWGETPCAFVTLKEGAAASEAEIIAFCRERLAGFKAPRTVVFAALPKTSTGKVQKYILRERAIALGDS